MSDNCKLPTSFGNNYKIIQLKFDLLGINYYQISYMTSDCALYLFNQIFICEHRKTSNRIGTINTLFIVTNDINHYNVCITLASHKRKLISINETRKVSAKLRKENVVPLSNP